MEKLDMVSYRDCLAVYLLVAVMLMVIFVALVPCFAAFSRLLIGHGLLLVGVELDSNRRVADFTHPNMFKFYFKPAPMN